MGRDHWAGGIIPSAVRVTAVRTESSGTTVAAVSVKVFGPVLAGTAEVAADSPARRPDAPQFKARAACVNWLRRGSKLLAPKLTWVNIHVYHGA